MRKKVFFPVLIFILVLLPAVMAAYYIFFQRDAVSNILIADAKRNELIDKLPLNRYWEIPEDILINYLEHKIKILSGPEGMELDLAYPEAFEGFLPRDWRIFSQNKERFIPVLLGRLKNFDSSAALILGYLKVSEALPLIREAFIRDNYFYGWEGNSNILDPIQYPHHYCYEEALEHITGVPIEEYIKLTPAELKDLKTRKNRGENAARYVLYRLIGDKS